MKGIHYLMFFVAAGLLFQSTAFSQDDVPTLSSPSDGATLTTTAVTFSWDSPVSSASDYELQVTTDPSWNSISSDVSSTSGATSYPLTVVDGPGTYYWRVRAYISLGVNSSYWGAFTSAQHFIVSLSPQITNYSGTVPAGWGAVVSIYGNNFGNSQTNSQGTGSVAFSCGDPNIGTTVNANNITNWTNTEIDCYVPMHASSGAIIVTNAEGAANDPNQTVSYPISWGYNGGNCVSSWKKLTVIITIVFSFCYFFSFVNMLIT
jgi:hypothetical protein